MTKREKKIKQAIFSRIVLYFMGYLSLSMGLLWSILIYGHPLHWSRNLFKVHLCPSWNQIRLAKNRILLLLVDRQLLSLFTSSRQPCRLGRTRQLAVSLSIWLTTPCASEYGQQTCNIFMQDACQAKTGDSFDATAALPRSFIQEPGCFFSLSTTKRLIKRHIALPWIPTGTETCIWGVK